MSSNLSFKKMNLMIVHGITNAQSAYLRLDRKKNSLLYKLSPDKIGTVIEVQKSLSSMKWNKSIVGFKKKLIDRIYNVLNDG